MKILALISILLVLKAVESIQYCSPVCANAYTACTNASYMGCSTCAASIYISAINTSTSEPCVLISQVTMNVRQLLSTSMTLAGYQSSNMTSFICGSYNISGKYTANGYLYKSWTGLGLNHYQGVIRFSVGYMGTWSSENMRLIVSDGINVNQIINYNYNCTAAQQSTVCSGATDCFANYQFNITHSADFISLNFTTLSTQTNPLIQFWGVKDLQIYVRNCDPTCATCSGALNSNCLTCVPGLYLIGTLCIPVCPLYSIPKTQQCTTSCPASYFLNTLNNYCQPCATGCIVCTSIYVCQTWQNGSVNPQNIFYDNLELWIILLVAAVFLIGFLVWKFACSQKNFQDLVDQTIINQKQVSPKNKQRLESEEAVGPHWIEDIDEVNPTKISVKKKPRFRPELQGVGNTIQ